MPDDALPPGSMPAFLPTQAEAFARLAAFEPTRYPRERNALGGPVSRLSPYLTHGFVTLPQVFRCVDRQHPLERQHAFVRELAWREFFRHVWQRRGVGILGSLHAGPLPDAAYARELPADIREARTGVPVIDRAVRRLYAEGYLHNHGRLWLASYCVHVRRVHWRAGADWLFTHLLDGDLASNHLSWQWVAGTASAKPYVFNADNVALFAPPEWHSFGSVIDAPYEALEAIARGGALPPVPPAGAAPGGVAEPEALHHPPGHLRLAEPRPEIVAGRDVWLVHPWALREPPRDLPADTLRLGVWISDFHDRWAWSAARWAFAGVGMAEVTTTCWHADASRIAQALRGARSVRSVAEPHLDPWLAGLADCEPTPRLFSEVDRPCDSFSQWWKRATFEPGGSTVVTSPAGSIVAPSSTSHARSHEP